MEISAKLLSLHAIDNLQCFDKCCVGEPTLKHHPYLDKCILVIKPLASIRNYKIKT